MEEFRNSDIRDREDFIDIDDVPTLPYREMTIASPKVFDGIITSIEAADNAATSLFDSDNLEKLDRVTATTLAHLIKARTDIDALIKDIASKYRIENE